MFNTIENFSRVNCKVFIYSLNFTFSSFNFLKSIFEHESSNLFSKSVLICFRSKYLFLNLHNDPDYIFIASFNLFKVKLPTSLVMSKS